MARNFTAEEMREIADEIGNAHDYIHEKAADMLYQVADMMEREDEREGKYEYALVANGVMYNNHYCDFRSATLIRGAGEKIVRREVGEWEEVQNERLE